jgi:hypothetical protein
MAARCKTHTVRIEYFRNGDNRSKDGSIEPNGIFRICQITKVKENLYRWSIEIFDRNSWSEILHDGTWEFGTNSGGDNNFKAALEFVQKAYPEAIPIKEYNTNFTFFGNEAKIEAVKAKIAKLLEDEFGSDVTVCQDIV